MSDAAVEMRAQIDQDILRLSEEDERRYANIRKLSWAELEKRLEDRPDTIKDVQLMRLVLETARIDMRKDAQPAAPKIENHYKTLMISAQSLPPEKRLEIEAAIRGEMRELQEALDVLPEGEEDGE